ncbi:MAG: tRNA (N6-threonylcarbamoyladenosine(37)-N6)-methyltransferase TrmO, partial [Lachnospiraceae bacterium]|nr:tRNA (N6-threonylcarbamoyladenosine(37)-N6)-methyltransferase TrmO [Lachnospiraceae bacterium]
VEFPAELEEELPEELRGAVRDILACDPRTAYINDPERIWGVAYGGYNIRFTVQDMVCRVVEVQKTE